MATYANSRFMKTVNEWGRVEEWVMPGDEISQGDLNVGDDEWQNLLDLGAVVEEPYPEGLKDDPQTPPAEYFEEHPEEAPGAPEVTPLASNGGSGNGGDAGNPSPAPAPESVTAESAGATESTESTGTGDESGTKAPWQQ